MMKVCEEMMMEIEGLLKWYKNMFYSYSKWAEVNLEGREND